MMFTIPVFSSRAIPGKNVIDKTLLGESAWRLVIKPRTKGNKGSRILRWRRSWIGSHFSGLLTRSLVELRESHILEMSRRMLHNGYRPKVIFLSFIKYTMSRCPYIIVILANAPFTSVFLHHPETNLALQSAITEHPWLKR